MEGSTHVSGSTEDVRAAHGARTQSLFRDINERVKEINHTFTELLPVGDWVCECANDRCTERLYVPLTDYERIRSDGAWFLVQPGEQHVDPEIEDVAERYGDFWVVKKRGTAADLARAADPRAVGLRGQP